MLSANNISYSVGGKVLLEDVSLELLPGKLHLIIGPNGAGKSTLVKVLARLLTPRTGSVRYDSDDIAKAADIDLARRRAVLSQAVEIAFPLKVREVVMMGRYPHFGGRPGGVDEKVVDDVMSLFEVTEFADRDYETLSGGERQRVNFARVLSQLWRTNEELSATRFLFLDEPLTFLDIKHQIDFMKKVRQFTAAPDVVTVGVVHDLSLAARFADQIIVLKDGMVAATGEPRSVLTPEVIEDVFDVRPEILETATGPQIFFR